MLKEYRSF